MTLAINRKKRPEKQSIFDLPGVNSKTSHLHIDEQSLPKCELLELYSKTLTNYDLYITHTVTSYVNACLAAYGQDIYRLCVTFSAHFA